MKRYTALLTALILIIIVFAAFPGCSTEEAVQTADPQESEVITEGNGYRYDNNGWIYLHIEGEPYDRGFQHGKLVAEELEEIMGMLKGVTYIENGVEWEQLRDTAPELFEGKLDPELVEEMKGIAEGARSTGADITYEDILGWNAYEELTGYYWPEVVSGKLPDLVEQGKDHCSAFIATGSYTSDGKVVMAHNSWNTFYDGQYYNVVMDLVPSSGHRIFMQTAPGFIASFTDFFVTDAGLMGTETTIGSYDEFYPEGIPEFIRARKAMQGSENPDDFMRIMNDGNNGAYANSWLLADSATGEIVRFEQGLEYQGVDRTKDGYFVGFNMPYDASLRNLECTDSGLFFDIRTPIGARRVRLDQLMELHKGNIDTDIARQVLADHYDVYLKKDDNPCSRTIEGHYELDGFEYWQDRLPYSPMGAVDGKVTDSDMAENLSFIGRFGNSSGMAFDASKFLDEHPQWEYVRDYMKDRPSQPWTVFKAED